MDEKALLLAIGQMMDEKLAPISERLDSLEERVASENSKTRALVENKYDVIRNLLKEEYSPVAERVRDMESKLKHYDKLEAAVTEHEETLIDHNERLAKLEQAI